MIELFFFNEVCFDMSQLVKLNIRITTTKSEIEFLRARNQNSYDFFKIEVQQLDESYAFISLHSIFKITRYVLLRKI